MKTNYKTMPQKMPDASQVKVIWSLPGEKREVEVFSRTEEKPWYWTNSYGLGLTTDILEEHAAEGRAKFEAVTE